VFADRVDAAIDSRLTGKLKFYDGITHEGLFRIPKHVRALLGAEKRLMTQKKPIFFFK
jgi:hypothetical protein